MLWHTCTHTQTHLDSINIHTLETIHMYNIKDKQKKKKWIAKKKCQRILLVKNLMDEELELGLCG